MPGPTKASAIDERKISFAVVPLEIVRVLSKASMRQWIMPANRVPGPSEGIREGDGRKVVSARTLEQEGVVVCSGI